MADRSRAAELDRGAPSRLSEQGRSGAEGSEGGGAALTYLPRRGRPAAPSAGAALAAPIPQQAGPRRGRAAGGERGAEGTLRGRGPGVGSEGGAPPPPFSRSPPPVRVPLRHRLARPQPRCSGAAPLPGTGSTGLGHPLRSRPQMGAADWCRSSAGAALVLATSSDPQHPAENMADG